MEKKVWITAALLMAGIAGNMIAKTAANDNEPMTRQTGATFSSKAVKENVARDLKYYMKH